MIQKLNGPAAVGDAARPSDQSILDGTEDPQNKLPRQNSQAENRLRRQRHVEHLHDLGPSPLGHFLREIEVASGFILDAKLKRYARLPADFIRANGGSDFQPFLHLVDGGRS
jgi:hypothetical protein